MLIPPHPCSLSIFSQSHPPRKLRAKTKFQFHHLISPPTDTIHESAVAEGTHQIKPNPPLCLCLSASATLLTFLGNFQAPLTSVFQSLVGAHGRYFPTCPCFVFRYSCDCMLFDEILCSKLK